MITVDYAHTAYRDEPVEHLQTIFPDNGQKIYYQCKGCGMKLWPYTADSLENFAVNHEGCSHD